MSTYREGHTHLEGRGREGGVLLHPRLLELLGRLAQQGAERLGLALQRGDVRREPLVQLRVVGREAAQQVLHERRCEEEM